MLARSFPKIPIRPAIGLHPIVRRPPRATFATTLKLLDPSVSAIGYQRGQRTAQEIDIKTEGPVKPPGADDQRIAIPLNQSIYPQLTPTLSKFTLRNKVAVVTGGGRGLGLNMAQALAEVGVRGIAILDVQQDIGDRAARELGEQTGIDAWFYSVDVRNADAVSQTVKNAVDYFGAVDILINAAGIAELVNDREIPGAHPLIILRSSNMKAETYDITKFRRLIDINVTGTFITAQACAAHMIANGTRGSIINIASMSGTCVNFPQEQSCYNASKAAVIQLTRSLAAEWARHGIRVNSISPGYMDTALNRVPALEAQKRIWVDLTPQKRLGNVDDLNNLAVYLASEGSGFMTGANCIIDGGYTLW